MFGLGKATPELLAPATITEIVGHAGMPASACECSQDFIYFLFLLLSS